LQFENGDIGFTKRKVLGISKSGTLANDLDKEIATKIGAVNAIHAIGKNVSDFKQQLGGTESFPIMELIEKNGGVLSVKEKSDWLNKSPGYKADIQGNNAIPGVQHKPKDEVGSLGKKTKFAFREAQKDGKLKTISKQ